MNLNILQQAESFVHVQFETKNIDGSSRLLASHHRSVGTAQDVPTIRLSIRSPSNPAVQEQWFGVTWCGVTLRRVLLLLVNRQIHK
jgi:hypothetical protein